MGVADALAKGPLSAVRLHDRGAGTRPDLQPSDDTARERTAAEYRRLFDQSGFETTRIVETASPFSIVECQAV
jgi:hypothetical protein